MLRRCLAVALFLAPLAPGCTCSGSPPAPSASASASASASGAPAPSASGASSSGPEVSQQDPDVRPVYPPLSGPPHPLAQRLCDALHLTPARRRAECCQQQPSPGVEAECLRNLTGALAAGAVAIDEGELGKCEEASKATHAGCDWVAPFPFTPATPDACLGLLKGTRKAGALCRSTLECEGDAHCAGVGPTTTGRCAPAREAGPCGFPVDPLVTYTRQSSAEAAHPICKGFCDRRRCAPLVKEGEACSVHEACGPGHHCGDGKCKKGDAGKKGEPCLGTRCAPGLRCDQGTCVEPRKESEACERDEQCRGFCVAQGGDGAAAGKKACKARCDAFLPIRPIASGVPLRNLFPKKGK